MQQLIFEWDNEKDKKNLKKYGVTFKEAQSAFYDGNAIQFFDPDNSEHEDRYLLLGKMFSLKP